MASITGPNHLGRIPVCARNRGTTQTIVIRNATHSRTFLRVQQPLQHAAHPRSQQQVERYENQNAAASRTAAIQPRDAGFHQSPTAPPRSTNITSIPVVKRSSTSTTK